MVGSKFLPFKEVEFVERLGPGKKTTTQVKSQSIYYLFKILWHWYTSKCIVSCLCHPPPVLTPALVTMDLVASSILSSPALLPYWTFFFLTDPWPKLHVPWDSGFPLAKFSAWSSTDLAKLSCSASIVSGSGLLLSIYMFLQYSSCSWCYVNHLVAVFILLETKYAGKAAWAKGRLKVGNINNDQLCIPNATSGVACKTAWAKKRLWPATLANTTMFGGSVEQKLTQSYRRFLVCHSWWGVVLHRKIRPTQL